MKHFLKIFLSFLIGFLLIIGGGLYFYLDYEDERKQDEIQIKELDAKVRKERVNVLLLGIDSMDGNYDDKKAGASRTDTMMLLSMDLETKSAFILSLPRDSRVEIDGIEYKDKINHAHAFGGVELSLKTVKNLLGIPIHHYVRVDYNALLKTIDDLGGVEIDVPIDMDYEDPWSDPPLSIHLKKGLQTLDSQKSIELLRFRSGYADQDLGRIKTQQLFLDALIRKMVSPASITKVPNYLETMYMYVNTDMSQKEILSLAKDAIKINPDNIEKQTLLGEAQNIYGGSYYILDEEGIKGQLEYLLAGNYAPEPLEIQEEIQEEIQVDSKGDAIVEGLEIKTNDLNISVYNGSGYKNIARRASDLLKIEDIIVTATANASSFENEETFIYYKSDKELAKTIKKALGTGRISEGTKEVDFNEPDIAIILGKDFKNK